MFSKRLSLVFAVLLILASLAACAPLPPATQAPATQGAPAQQQPAATAAPAATATTAPTPTLVPTNTPAVPDPKTNPQGALLAAGNSKLFKTGEFTYTMTMTMTPADEASKTALGAQAAALDAATVNAKGTGAMDMSDPASPKMRMDIGMNAAGQDVNLSIVSIGTTAWVKMPGQSDWMKVEGDQAKSVTPSGVNPEEMLKYFQDAVDVQWIEDVTRDGEALSHLRFMIDPSKMNLSDLLAGNLGAGQSLSPEELQAMVKDMKPVVDVWLTKSGLELREQRMTLDWVMALPKEANVGDAKLRITMNMNAGYFNVNKPLTIEAPADAVTPGVGSEAATATPTK